jgi:drug/metabolite transporter (DMT)-like permease
MWEAVIPISIFVAFIWGATPTVHKYIFNNIQYMTPQTMIVFGGISYFIFTLVYGYCEKNTIIKTAKQIPLSLLLVMFLTAFMGFFANYLYFNVIGKHSSYVVSSLIFISPLFTLILSYLFLKEDISLKSVIGVILIVIGVILVALSKSNNKHSNMNIIKLNSTIKGD